MKALAIALRLLPLLIRAVEVALGARNGQLKRQAVLDLLFGVLRLAQPGLDTPENRELVGQLVDQIVAVLNEAGVFPARANP